MRNTFAVFADKQFQALAASHFLTTFGNSLLGPVLPVYLHTMGFVESQIGVIMGATATTALFVRPFVGMQADRRGSRPVLMLGQMFFVCSLGWLVLCNDTLSFSLARMLFGVSLAFYGTGAVTFASSIGVGQTNTSSIAFYTLVTMLGLGASMGLSQFSYETFGFAACVAGCCALIALAWGVMAWRSRPIPVARGQGRRVSFAMVLRARAVVAASTGQFGSSVAFGALFTYVPLAAVKGGVALYSLFFIAFAATVIVSRFFVQRSIDSVGLVRTCLGSYVVMLVAVAILIAPPSQTSLAVSGALFGVGFGVTFPSFVLVIVRRISAGVRGTALGILIACGDIGIALAAALLGSVAEHFGYPWLFACVTAVLLVSLCVLARLLRDPRVSPRSGPKDQDAQPGRWTSQGKKMA